MNVAFTRTAKVAASHDSASAPRDFLDGIPVAFCDSRAGLERAGEVGLPAEAVVRASSPALVQMGGRVEALEGRLESGRIQAIHDDAYPLCVELWSALRAEPDVGQFALGAAVHALRTQRILLKAACLSEDDFWQPRAIIAVLTGSEFSDWKFNAPWEALLSVNSNLRILRVPYRPPSETQTTRLLDRVRLSWESRAYRILLALGRRLPPAIARGSAYVLSENELQREAAVALGARGFRLLRLPEVKAHATSISPSIASRLTTITTAVALRRYSSLACPPAAQAVSRLLVDAVLKDASAQAAATDAWAKAAPTVFRKGDLVLAGFPKGPQSRGLWSVCRSNGIKTCSFQHGVTREIAVANRAMRVGHEANTSDVFFAFNRRGVETAKDNPFTAGQAVAVGLPDEYHRTGGFRRRRKKSPPIFYVSTNLYVGNGNLPQGDLSDSGRAQLETAVIERLLERIPHRVLYKTYPDRRYPDDDPVAERARKAANIELFDAPLNLRYLLPDCRVIVTSRATSTTSWCLMSGKPMVFIDWPQQSPLLAEVRDAFSRAVFLFDGSEPDVLDRAREFLSQPLERIEALYAARAGARAVLIDGYFSTGGRGAGQRAARAILEMRGGMA